MFVIATPAARTYEWAVPTGGHGLRFKNPRMVVTLQRSTAQLSTPRLPLPNSTDIVSLATSLGRSGSGGKPTAVMPSPEEFKEVARRVALKRPAEMTEWQFERVMGLYKVGGDGVTDWIKAVDAGDRLQYERLIREILATPPRYWKGWSIQDDLLIWYLYRDLLPAPIRDHIKAYWEAWLMPDVPTRQMFHPQSREAADYWLKTKDWRGRTSFFRDGYNFVTSTQNFNHMAVMGALLGGNIISSEYAMADGRYGLEHFPMRLWAMLDGSTQEMLDHYYFSITLSAQKMLADFAPTALDQLMGRIILDRSMELLATAYHPGLRRFINASGRARLSGVLVEQDGIYGALHTISKQGAVNYLDEPFGATVHGMPVWGYDFPPGRVAIQSLQSKWVPDWFANVIDDKAFPFEETSTETTRGTFNPPLWRRMYLGRHYGLASQDIKGGTVDVMAQWNHKADPATAMEDVGTLTLRYVINEPDMATTQGGTMPYAGSVVTYQHKNRAIVFTKPGTEKERIVALAGNDGLLSSEYRHRTLELSPERELETLRRWPEYHQVSHEPQGRTSHHDQGWRKLHRYYPIARHRPGPHRRSRDRIGGGGKSEPNGATIKPALTITSYNFQKDTPVAFDQLDWPTINNAAYGGFIIELGDVTEYGDFAAFSKRMRENTVATHWEPGRKLLNVAYRSGQDLMEAGFATDFEQSEVHFAIPPGQQTKALPYRRFNGAWPYLPPRIDRDTTLSQQGTTGRLEKNGAVLVTEEDRKSYLQTDPASGTYVGYNPLPDPTSWSFSVPGGATIRANGKVSLLRVAVQPNENQLWIDYATKPDQDGPEMATSMLAFGFADSPVVFLNRKPISGPLKTTSVDGRTGYIVPLRTP